MDSEYVTNKARCSKDLVLVYPGPYIYNQTRKALFYDNLYQDGKEDFTKKFYVDNRWNYNITTYYFSFSACSFKMPEFLTFSDINYDELSKSKYFQDLDTQIEARLL